MPTRIDRSQVTDTPRREAGRVHAQLDTPHTRRVDAALRGATAGHAAYIAQRDYWHTALHHGLEWFFKSSCERCSENIAQRENAKNEENTRNAENAAAQRANRANLATREATRDVDTSGDTPRRIGRKRRTTRVVVSPTLTGDRTDNGTPRRVRATQRYELDTVTRVLSDTLVTSERHAVRRVRRNHSPLVVRGNGGDIDATRTLLLVAYYRHALACLQSRNER